MNSLNTKKLLRRFSFFHPEKGMQQTLMCFGFECDDGWFDLLWELCEGADKILKEKKIKDFEVVQVKEKFGGLRFYCYGSTEEIEELIRIAENKSYKTCESCGKPGKPNKEGWIVTLCKKCRTARNKERGI